MSLVSLWGPGIAVSAAEEGESIDLGVDAGQPTTTLSFEPENFPEGSAGRELAERAADLDPYRATDSEVADLQQEIDELVFDQRSKVAALQPAIDELDGLDSAMQQERDELQPVVDELGYKVSGLAIQSFQTSNGAYASMSIGVAESEVLDRERRVAHSLSIVAEDSTEAYIAVAAELELIVDQHTELQTQKATLEQQQASFEEALTAATGLQQRFASLADTRAQRIQQRSDEAIAAESTDTPFVQVGPFIVNQQLEAPLTALLTDAAADGIVFAGWGQRPVSRQIELRRSNCGNSEWALFDKRSGTCGPPTARPGHSQHELGLAIDFTENGTVLNRSSPGFIWLAANAARYGLKNLPSEPWHWSTTGN